MFIATFILHSLCASQQPIVLRPGMVITRSGTVVAREYNFPNSDNLGKSSAITIRGDNLTIDFKGATLRGSSQDTLPNERVGTAVRVEGKGVMIRNLNVHGYKIGIIAKDAHGLRLIDCDVSYNWKQRLLSTLEREDTADWMSYHHNEKDEWLRYGCGVYLRNCDNVEIKRMRATGGQNGLMMTECDNALVWNSDFSFLSGCGIAMYRSSDCRIMYNKIDWCVRGYSHGVYNRGQDSAGIIVYEQSHRNTFAYNSATHGGDGFFLWAGQTTMDTGQGGCNDNLIYGNDFSHAPTNGVEMTFSRNKVINNRIDECWHGIWGGFSFDSVVFGNTFFNNDEAIAVEHGQRNHYFQNMFINNRIGITLWSNKTLDPNWGYPKHRDVRSMESSILANTFIGPGTALALRDTETTSIANNIFIGADRVLNAVGDFKGTTFFSNRMYMAEQPMPGIEASGNSWVTDRPAPRPRTEWNPHQPVFPEVREHAPKPLEGGLNAFLPPGALRGRKYILVNEWGPHDFRSPILWQRGTEQVTTSTGVKQTWEKLEIIGPPGTWRVVSDRGVAELSARSGSSPGFLSFRPRQGSGADVFLELEYVGEQVVTPFGRTIPKGQPYRFSHSRFFIPIQWKVNWYTWDKDTSDPRTQIAEFERRLTGTPIKSETTDRLAYDWGGEIGPNLPGNYFATHAVGEFEIENGTYLLDVITDDGVRVWLDGKLLIDQWHWQGPTLYTREVRLGGKHRLEIKHFEIDGFAALKASLKPKR